MAFDTWLVFALACLALALIPGPGVATIVGFALGSGRRVAIASVGGMALGNFIAITLSLAGAGALLAASALAFTLLKWAGALYLIVLGALAIARSRPGRPDAPPRAPISATVAFVSTVAVGTFHPKTILFFVAFAAQFVRPDAPYLPQAIVMALTFPLIAAITDAGYALLAARLSGMLRRPRFALWTGRIGGGALIGAGVATAMMRR